MWYVIDRAQREPYFLNCIQRHRNSPTCPLTHQDQDQDQVFPSIYVMMLQKRHTQRTRKLKACVQGE